MLTTFRHCEKEIDKEIFMKARPQQDMNAAFWKQMTNTLSASKKTEQNKQNKKQEQKYIIISC